MLETIAVILIIMWLLGFGFHVLGAFIHILLIVAVVVILIRIINGRRAV